MSPRSKAVAAVVLAGLALLFLGANVVLVWTVDAAGSAGRPPAATLWLLGLAGAPVVGAIIAGKRPDNPYGWLLLSFGVTSALLELTELYALFALERYGAAGGAGLAGALVSQTLWGATIGHIPLLLLMFPDGALPSPRWAWLRRAVVGCTIAGSLTALFIPGELGVVPVPNPIGADGVVGDIVQVVVAASVAAIFAAMLPAAASLFVRQRRATPQERLQLRWFSWAAAIMAVALLVGGFGAIDSEVVVNAIMMAGFMGLFGAIGVAVLRYRLYEIDRVLSRTVSYAALTVLVVAVYLTVVTLLTRATSLVTGESPLAVAASTLLTAAVIGPARVRIQSVVDRRFNRAHYDAVRTADAFRARLRDQFDLQDIGDDLVATTRATMQPSTAMVWLRRPSEVPR